MGTEILHIKFPLKIFTAGVHLERGDGRRHRWQRERNKMYKSDVTDYVAWQEYHDKVYE